MTTFTEDQIRARHKERVSALVDLFGSTMAIPNDIIKRLQERNKEDWIQFVAERDGKAKSDPNAPLMPVVTDEQVTAVETVDPDHCYADERNEDCFGADENCAPDLTAEPAGDLPTGVSECIAAGTHGQSYDDNGNCSACGLAEAPDTAEIS